MALWAYALTTVSGVKRHYDFDFDDTDAALDAELERLINAVSKLFEVYTDRTFLTRTFTEYFSGEGKYLFPDHYPITSVSGIYDDINWVWGSDTLISGTNYRVMNEGTIVFKNEYLGEYDDNVKIVYTAGYETVPYDVEQACIEEVIHRYRMRQQPDITSKQLEDGTVAYTQLTMLPQVIQAQVPYKRKEVL